MLTQDHDKLCKLCGGKGEVKEDRDMHRSAGIISCPLCYGTGKSKDQKIYKISPCKTKESRIK